MFQQVFNEQLFKNKLLFITTIKIRSWQYSTERMCGNKQSDENLLAHTLDGHMGYVR